MNKTLFREFSCLTLLSSETFITESAFYFLYGLSFAPLIRKIIKFEEIISSFSLFFSERKIIFQKRHPLRVFNFNQNFFFLIFAQFLRIFIIFHSFYCSKWNNLKPITLSVSDALIMDHRSFECLMSIPMLKRLPIAMNVSLKVMKMV